MKKAMSRTEAKNKIDGFFQRGKFDREEMRKIKRLAMKYRIPLKEHKKQFCKKCLSELKGKTRIKKEFKIVECGNCSHRNKFKMHE